MNNHTTEVHAVSQGVDELIERLRQEGVDKGNREAEAHLIKAKKEAKSILEVAHRQAQLRLSEARKEAAALRSGGEEALKTAMRDMVLTMKTELTEEFKSDVRRLVEHELQQPDLLRRLIIEIAGKLRKQADIKDDETVEVYLPDHVIGLDELRDAADKLAGSPLTEMVFGLTRDMLNKGVSFHASQSGEKGIQVQLVDRDVRLDMSEKAVADMLLEHLQPRFRAILEGVVR